MIKVDKKLIKLLKFSILGARISVSPNFTNARISVSPNFTNARISVSPNFTRVKSASHPISQVARIGVSPEIPISVSEVGQPRMSSPQFHKWQLFGFLASSWLWDRSDKPGVSPFDFCNIGSWSWPDFAIGKTWDPPLWAYRSWGGPKMPSSILQNSKSETPDLSDLCLDNEREVDFLFFFACCWVSGSEVLMVMVMMMMQSSRTQKLQ